MVLLASRMLRECKRVEKKSRKEFLGQTVKKNSRRERVVSKICPSTVCNANALSISREAGDSPPPVLQASVLFRGGAYYLTTPFFSGEGPTT